MVFYFTSKVEPTALIYMGRDKHENEFLIKYAQHHDVWFHVSNLSSAHVYLRTETPITSYDEISKELVAECAQLTKANSIEGCKRHDVGINYTWATNLLKTGNMETGSVSFKKPKLVKTVHIEKNKDIIREVLKSKRELDPDFEKDYRDYLKEIEREKNAKILEEKKAAAEEEKKGKEAKKKAKEEWDDFFGAANEDDKVYAGGSN